MPKVILIKQGFDYGQLMKDIEYLKIDADINTKTVYKAAGLSQSSFCNRKRDPGSFRVKELANIAKVAKKKLVITFE